MFLQSQIYYNFLSGYRPFYEKKQNLIELKILNISVNTKSLCHFSLS